MEKQELKKQQWEKLSEKYKHLIDFCTIKINGIDDDTPYFHPQFVISDDAYITSQCDVSNKEIYALSFVWIDKGINIEIGEHLLDAIIIGFHTNKKVVEISMDTMQKVRNHISTLRMYTDDYITNMLIGNSINEVTDAFINELKANQKLISFLQKN